MSYLITAIEKGIYKRNIKLNIEADTEQEAKELFSKYLLTGKNEKVDDYSTESHEVISLDNERCEQVVDLE